jgi:microcystin-dependent protein
MMQDPFLGQITLYPYNFAPFNWATCEGQLLPISQNAALFSLLGTNFGGNGTSTFALPDLRGRVPLGMGQLTGGGDYLMGEEGGEETVAINPATMAQHNHSLNAATADGMVNNPSGQLLAQPLAGDRQHGSASSDIYNPGTPNTTLVPATLSVSGNNIPHKNLQPSLVLTPCIALRGVFPSRN